MDETDKENPLDRKSKVNYDNFMLELNSNGYINREELTKEFRLDVESYTNKDGLFVVQGEKILRKPYDASFSTRKINEQINTFPTGFSKIFYAQGTSSVVYTNPAEPIPSGCWCTVDICNNIGPNGHSHYCSYPNQLSLNLTLKGFVECIYSTDKTYRSRLRENDSSEIKDAVDYFVALVDELSEEIGKEPTDEIFIKAAIATHENVRFKFLYKIPKSDVTDLGKIFTNFKYQIVRNIANLNNDRINYFHGATLIQYYSIIDGVPKKSSIRIYSDAKITIISCNWDEKKSYEKMIVQVYDRINETDTKISPKDAFISVARGSFRLVSELLDKGINLETFYKAFHPTDELGNPKSHNDYMSSHTYILEGGKERVRRFVQEGKNKYEYSITEEGRGKLSMNFIKYEDNEPTNYKINTQLFNTGIVQLTFAYKDDESKEVEKQIIKSLGGNIGNINAQIESQTKNIRIYFELIRKFIVTAIDKMFNNKLDIFADKEVSKRSDKVFNVIPGVMPYGKKKHVYAGYIIDFFDDNRDEWHDNYGWSNDDSERGVIVGVEKSKKGNSKNIYKIITGKPRLEKIIETPSLLKFKFKNALECPIVELADSDPESELDLVYLIEKYVEGKMKHWVISGEIDEYTIDQFRIHKQSINDNEVYIDSQVCDKTKAGIDIRPDPYSFYGKCVHPDTSVLMTNGKLKSIKELIKNNNDSSLINVVDPVSRKVFSSGIKEFQNYDVYKYGKNILKVTTRSGRSIIVTDDHAFARQDGNFMDAKDLKINDQVLILPVSTKINQPIVTLNKQLLDISTFTQLVSNSNVVCQKTIITDAKELEMAGLLPLMNNDPRVIILASLVGYSITDGSVNSSVEFYMGCKEDVDALKNEASSIGVGHITDGHINKSIFTNTTTSKVTNYTTWRLSISGSLARLLIALGATPGNKTKQLSILPNFVINGNLETKRAFLSAIFGGDGSSLWYSKCLNRYKLESPSFCLSKDVLLEENLENYLNDIKNLLFEFGIKTSNISKHSITEEKIALRFVISTNYQNIINFVDNIEFKWCKQKQNKMYITSEYIRYCLKCINETSNIKNKVIELRKTCMPYSKISKILKISQSKVVYWDNFYKDKSSTELY
jgi:intein/homing endonuclease